MEFVLGSYTAAEKVVLPPEFFPTDASVMELGQRLSQQTDVPWELRESRTFMNVVTGEEFDVEFHLSYAEENGDGGPCTYWLSVFL